MHQNRPVIKTEKELTRLNEEVVYTLHSMKDIRRAKREISKGNKVALEELEKFNKTSTLSTHIKLSI